ncbi:MAG: hypothetical protein WBQ94_27640 [Terracidiphilus sp.]
MQRLEVLPRTYRSEPAMLFELARPLSFFLSMLSLYPVMMHAFFVPGTRWPERLLASLLHIALAGCVCFMSGLLYSRPSPATPEGEPLMSTFPVRMFLWTMVGMALLFALSWFLEEYFVPLMRHDCCRP